MKLKRLMAALTFAAAGVSAVSAVAAVDPALPTYEKTSGVSGNLSSVGSDSLANLMTLWAEEFKKNYPNVNIQIQAAGSSTAPPALTEGTANMGPMSRPMKDSEIQAFEEKYGYKPTAVPVAIDALAVFVHKDNPIKSLSIEQVDAIFSSTRLCGYDKDIKTWGDLGLTGEWANRPLQLFGRNSVSGTYGYFKEEALCKGDFNQPQRAAGFGFRGAVDLQHPERHRLLGYRLQDLQRPCRTAVEERRRSLRSFGRERRGWQVPAGSLLLRLREQGAEPAAEPAGCRVHQAGAVQARSGSGGQGWLHPAAVESGREDHEGTGSVSMPPR